MLISAKGVRKIAVLGDMLDLGPKSCDYHREVGKYAGERGVEVLIGIGQMSRFTCEGAEEYLEKENVRHFDKKEDFLNIMSDIVKSGDVILVKGSRGMAMETVVKKILE